MGDFFGKNKRVADFYSGVKSKSQPGNMLIICLKFSKFQPVYASKGHAYKKRVYLCFPLFSGIVIVCLFFLSGRDMGMSSEFIINPKNSIFLTGVIIDFS